MFALIQQIFTETTNRLAHKIYFGDWHNGKYEGKGRTLSADNLGIEEYDGDFHEGKRHGEGELKLHRPMSFDDANEMPYSYVGSFNGDEYHGLGTEQYRDGLSYFSGKFMKGQRNGEGLEKFSDGKWFKGEYLNNKPHGYGKLYSANNILIFEGEYKYGKKNGYGTEFGSDGKPIYEGKFRNDLRHGYGICKNPDGILAEQNFKKNKLTSPYDAEELSPSKKLKETARAILGTEIDGVSLIPHTIGTVLFFSGEANNTLSFKRAKQVSEGAEYDIFKEALALSESHGKVKMNR